MKLSKTRKEVFELRKTIPRPTVWRRFERKTENGNIRKFIIQDVTNEDSNECLALVHQFLKDEPISTALGVPQDTVSLNEIIENWKKFIGQNLSVVCYEVISNENILVGFNVNILYSKEDEEEDIEKYKGESYRNLLKILKAVEDTCPMFERYDVDIILSSSGMIVKPDYRGLAIGTELLLAREPYCKALNILATVTVFTATSSQISAQRAGFETLGCLDYHQMLNYGIDYSGIKTPSAKLMGKKYTFS